MILVRLFDTLKLLTWKIRSANFKQKRKPFTRADRILHGVVQLKAAVNILKNEDKIENRETEEASVLKEEVEKTVRMLKNG